MGSPWFYLEFLLAWLDLLSTPDGRREKPGKTWRNPAVFAPDYTLVPMATFPTQVKQALQGWEFVCGVARDAETRGTDVKLEVAGDSAGGTLCLSLLLLLAQRMRGGSVDGVIEGGGMRMPDHATLISAWCRLVSEQNQDTPSDFLNAESLHLYARQYLGDGRLAEREGFEITLASPADFRDQDIWKAAIPACGMHFVFGSEEVLAGEMKDLIKKLEGLGRLRVSEEAAGIHAWPVVDLFLGGPERRRLKGLRNIVHENQEVFSE